MTTTQATAAGGTSAGSAGAGAAAAARSALGRAARHLLDLQDDQGWWQGELETNVSIDAEDLLLREFLGIRTAQQTEETARWIRSQQRADGTWSNSYEGKPDLSTTIEAYVALRLAGDSPDAYHLAQAAGWIRAAGGIAASRVFTRIWLALFGEWSWDDLPVMPPELIYLPGWFPLNVSDWGCWARQTIVPLTIVGSLRPARPLPFGLAELHAPAAGQAAARPADPWARVFGELDRALHVYHRRGLKARPLRAVRAAAIRRCTDWIIARQEKDGCWGGIQPPWVYSIIALHLLGYELSHPILERALAGLEGFTVREQTQGGMVRRLEACQSPVWDTVLAMIALADAGLPADHEALVRAGNWVVSEEIRGPGDWQARRPGLEPGGWAFEFHNDTYPDIDDTAEVLLALRRTTLPGPAARQATERGIRWLTGMQSRDGGWGAFDADNTRQLCTKLPFCDFGAVIDPPSADVTAHAIEALSQEGRAGSRAVRRGVAWLLRAQEPDGSWFGRWGANYVYGTGAVVPALITAGVLPGKPVIQRAVRWLAAHQNPDGGWGEDLRSYEQGDVGRQWAGRGESTASQTAWALLALLAAGGPADAIDRGVGWLARTQRPDGGWDEPQFTGTGFPRDFYINYHLYRLVFPVNALGRYLAGHAADPPPDTGDGALTAGPAAAGPAPGGAA